VILEIVPKAAYNKYPITEEKPERNSETAFGTIFTKTSVTKMHGQKLFLNFN
jgi:hypothetical protein